MVSALEVLTLMRYINLHLTFDILTFDVVKVTVMDAQCGV